MNNLSNKNNITRLSQEKPQFETHYFKQSTRFEFDERYLYESWNSKYSTGSKHYLLHDLSPKLALWRHREESSVHKLKWGLFFTLSAIIVWFSIYNAKLPLLAPVLLTSGVLFLGFALFSIKPKSWTYIYDDDGNYVSSIRINQNETDNIRQNREDFQNLLITAIEKAKQKEYYE